MIVTDLLELRKPVPVSDFKPKEGEVIAAALFTELKKNRGWGLSANQIGINKRVCVVTVKEPFYLVNPVIVEKSEEQYVFIEACLSIPKTSKKPVRTVRYGSITVTADNFGGTLEFGPDDDSTWEDDPSTFWEDTGFLECVAVQHEIDHLNGITIRDRRAPQEPIQKKFERNKKYLFVSPDGDFEFMKHKHGSKLIEMGWTIQM